MNLEKAYQTTERILRWGIPVETYTAKLEETTAVI